MFQLINIKEEDLDHPLEVFWRHVFSLFYLKNMVICIILRKTGSFYLSWEPLRTRNFSFYMPR